jgi:hypothetical protein
MRLASSRSSGIQSACEAALYPRNVVAAALFGARHFSGQLQRGQSAKPDAKASRRPMFSFRRRALHVLDDAIEAAERFAQTGQVLMLVARRFVDEWLFVCESQEPARHMIEIPQAALSRKTMRLIADGRIVSNANHSGREQMDERVGCRLLLWRSAFCSIPWLRIC